MKIIDRLKNEEPHEEAPWNVWSILFGRRTSITVFDGQSSIGEGDFASLEDTQKAIEWLVDQYGGKVKWQK